MLPEKRKKLIVLAISIVVATLVIIGLVSLSNYIKKSSTTTLDTRRDDTYISEYAYFGVTIDESNRYNLYGINSTEEVSFELGTFYNVQSLIIRNNHILLYSDATNEVRYDSEEDIYYFYEINTYYSNNYTFNLTTDYIVMNDDTQLSYWEFTSDTKINITNNLNSNSVYVSNNVIYYYLLEGLYTYNLDTKEEECLLTTLNDGEILGILNNYLYIEYQSNIIIYDLTTNNWYDINSLLNGYSYISMSTNGFLYLDNGILKEYNISAEESTPIINLSTEEIEKCYYIADDIYYMVLSSDNETTRYVIVSLDEQKVIRELDNDYLCLVKGGYDED